MPALAIKVSSPAPPANELSAALPVIVSSPSVAVRYSIFASTVSVNTVLALLIYTIEFADKSTSIETVV